MIIEVAGVFFSGELSFFQSFDGNKRMRSFFQ